MWQKTQIVDVIYTVYMICIHCIYDYDIHGPKNWGFHAVPGCHFRLFCRLFPSHYKLATNTYF